MKRGSSAQKLRNARYRDALRLRVLAALGPGSIRAHADEFELNSETLRRWLRGHSTMPAWFVAAVALRRGESPEYILLGRRNGRTGRPDDPGYLDRELLERLRAIVEEVESLREVASVNGCPIGDGAGRRVHAGSD